VVLLLLWKRNRNCCLLKPRYSSGGSSFTVETQWKLLLTKTLLLFRWFFCCYGNAIEIVAYQNLVILMVDLLLLWKIKEIVAYQNFVTPLVVLLLLWKRNRNCCLSKPRYYHGGPSVALENNRNCCLPKLRYFFGGSSVAVETQKKWLLIKTSLFLWWIFCCSVNETEIVDYQNFVTLLVVLLLLWKTTEMVVYQNPVTLLVTASVV
jgi:hypothetical protein